MSDYPQTLMPGDHITKTWIDQLLRALRRQRPLAGPGIRTKVTPNGTVLKAETVRPKATKAETPSLFPFKVRFAPSEEEGAEPHDGDFLVYIPDGSLSVDGHTPGGADFALDEREDEAGWFVLPSIDQDAELWISFEYAPAEDPPLQCGVGTSPAYENPDDVHGTIARSVHIADIEFPEDAPPKVTQVTRGPLSYEFFVDSLNGAMGNLSIVGDPSPITIGDEIYYVTVTRDEGSSDIVVGLSTEPPESNPQGYCNEVSHDGEDSMSPDNDISQDGDNDMQPGGGGGGADGNAISRWPCKKEQDQS